MKWQDKLTKDELRHVKRFGHGTLTDFKLNRCVQLQQVLSNILKGYGNAEPCEECYLIAKKLGLE